jgi:hypothetical protein
LGGIGYLAVNKVLGSRYVFWTRVQPNWFKLCDRSGKVDYFTAVLVMELLTSRCSGWETKYGSKMRIPLGWKKEATSFQRRRHNVGIAFSRIDLMYNSQLDNLLRWMKKRASYRHGRSVWGDHRLLVSRPLGKVRTFTTKAG